MFFKVAIVTTIVACIKASGIDHDHASFNLYSGHHVGKRLVPGENVQEHGSLGAAYTHDLVHHGNYDTVPNYEYKYKVVDHSTGDHKSQHEVRSGGVVKGEYSLMDPDGTFRKVEYTADDQNGFNAVVSKTGKSFYPETLPTSIEQHANLAKFSVPEGHIPLAHEAHGSFIAAAPTRHGWSSGPVRTHNGHALPSRHSPHHFFS